MALRRTHNALETSTPGVAYYVDVITKTPFKSIDNESFCIWQYRIRFVLGTQLSMNNFGEVGGQLSDGPPHTFSVKVGLEFSSRIDIKLPALYPECQPVQGTSVLRGPTGSSQYVWQQLQVQRTVPDHIDLFFIAPCEEDPFTPIHLVSSPSEGAPWTNFPFQVTGQADPCATQVIRGPAIVVSAACTQPPPAGTQPTGTPPASPTGTQPTAPAGTPPVTPAPSASGVELTNSKRILYSASHLSTKLTDSESSAMNATTGGALRKVNVLRALSLNQDSHAKLGEQISQLAPHVQAPMRQLLAASSQLASEPGTHLQIAKAVAALPNSAVLSFAQLAASTAPAQSYLHLITDIFEAQTKISPVGRLYLERLEMFPAGVERGELVFTVPMAPGESTTISHKEWSTSSRGYEDVVQDFFENYSERGVTEKTDSSTAAESEVNRSNSLNFGATLTGSYGPVSLTTTLGLMTAGSERQSIKTSMQRNQEITEKSSARVRQEHKVSIKIESKQGMDSTSYKTITNPSPDAVRIDYYKMMRKWRTDLYRYGLRLTYDICIPTPGLRLWARWRRVAEIDASLAAPLQFGWKPEDINEGWVHAEALKLGILVDDPPPFTITPASVFDSTPYASEDDSGAVRFGRIEFDVPPGYQLASANFTANLARWADQTNWLNVLNADFSRPDDNTVTSSLPQHIGNTGRQAVSYAYLGISQAALRVEFTCVRQTATFIAWQKAIWHQLHDAAAARYQEQNARLQGERDILWRALAGKDTLSLRRLEREEMLRLIMLWILGPDAAYANAPAWIETTVNLMLADEVAFLQNKGVPATPSPSFGGIDGTKWSQALIFGDFVKFVQQAIEWENLLYFLYPYFWGSEGQGRDKMLFEHPDPEHQNFLRAGYCRVVITVRPGFEEDFTRLVEVGSLKQVGSPGNVYTSPYLPIAEEIANRALTNYAGIPPANPEKHARPLLYPQQRQTWATMELVIGAIEKFKLDNGEYPATLAALPAGLKTDDAWGNSLVYANPGSGNDYDLISLGSDNALGGEDTAADISSAAGASLMASWYDYTPTSGIDIVLNTSPALIA